MTDQPNQSSTEAGETGLRCPACGCAHLPVYYTRNRDGGIIVRVRFCRNCGQRVVTREKINAK